MYLDHYRKLDNGSNFGVENENGFQIGRKHHGKPGRTPAEKISNPQTCNQLHRKDEVHKNIHVACNNMQPFGFNAAHNQQR